MSNTNDIRVELPSGATFIAPALGLSIKEAARLSGIGQHELRRRVRAGEIKVIAKGQHRVIPLSRLLEFLERASNTEGAS